MMVCTTEIHIFERFREKCIILRSNIQIGQFLFARNSDTFIGAYSSEFQVKQKEYAKLHNIMYGGNGFLNELYTHSPSTHLNKRYNRV